MLQRLSILGFGNLEVSFSVVAAISNFFGEREIELYTWDASKEQCDIMCRVTRVFLKVNRTPFIVYSLETPDLALHASDGAILCSPIDIALDIPTFDVATVDWKIKRDWGRDEAKFQALRYINREEYPSVEIYTERQSPLLDWLKTL